MTFISKSEAARLAGTTVRSINRAIAAGLIRTRPDSRIAANGKRPDLVCLDDLGPEAIQRYHASRVAPPAPTLSVVASPPAPPPTADHDPAAPTSPAPVIEPSAGAVEEATRKLPIVEAAFALKVAHHKTATPAVNALARAHAISPSTLRGWMAAYRRDGFTGLIPQHGRRPSLDPTVERFIQQAYLAPKQPLMATFHERTAAFCAEIRHPAPSYTTVVRACAKIPQSVSTYHRLGKKAWALTYEPILRRDYTDLAVGEMFCGDHRELDFFVKVGGKIQRPWLTAWMDLRSRLLVGWHLGLTPNSRTIALAFHHAVLACGRPAFVYIDNGKDYKSHALNGREVTHGRIQYDAETQGVFGGIGTGVIHALPYAARSKPIERWFRNLSDRFDRDQPGWCGRNTMLRPEKLAREIKSGALLTLDEVPAKLAAFIAAYNDREHSELKCAPASLWEHATKEIPDARTLTLLLMKSKPTRVWNDGIHLHTMRYWASELSGVIGETVEARYDPADVSRLYVFHQRALLCEAATAITGSMKVGEAQILQKAKERKAARARVQRYPDDIRILHDPDEALRVAVGARQAEPALPPPPPAVATRGDVVPLFLLSDRAGREVAALPAPEPVHEAPAAAVAVNDAWQIFADEQFREMGDRKQRQADAEAAAEATHQEHWRQYQQGGGA